MNKWLTVKNEQGSPAAEIYINGQIGDSWYDESAKSAKQFRDELNSIPKGRPINLRINSEGGSVQDGLEMYNCIKERSSDVTAIIDGYALSTACWFPLSSGKVSIPKSAILMMHDASSFTQGDADEHRKTAEMLDKHSDTIAGIYASELGKSKNEMRAAMKDETWFTGGEAVKYGFGDDPDENEEAENNRRSRNLAGIVSFAKSTGVRIPANVMNMLSAPRSAVVGNVAHSDTNQKGNQMETKDAVAAPAKPADENSDKILKLTEQVESLRRTGFMNAVRPLIAAQKATKHEADALVELAMSNEQAFNLIIQRFNDTPTPVQDSKPVSPGYAKVGSEGPIETIRKIENRKKRVAYMKDNWSSLLDECRRRGGTEPALNGDGRGPVVNAQFAAALTTEFLLDGAITVLQNRWAPLALFQKDYSVDRYKPLAVAEAKIATGAGTTITVAAATNFETGSSDSTVGARSITPVWYSQPYRITQWELSSGGRMEDLVVINTAAFADTVVGAAVAPITVANYAAPSAITAAAATFGFGDLMTLWGLLKKAHIKNIMLDGEYLAKLLNQPTLFQRGIDGEADTGLWTGFFGWNNVALNTAWSGAGANVVGFACAPQAILALSGLPLEPPAVPGNTLSESTVVLPSVGITIAHYSWFSLATRTYYNSLDVVFGCSKGDTTAGVIIKSA